jgi:hypothetical protein
MEVDEEIPQTAIVHERAEETKNNTNDQSESNSQELVQSESVKGVEPVNVATQASSPYMGMRSSDSAANVLPGSPSLSSVAPPYFNFDDYVSRDELKLIEEAILTLRQDTKINFVKVRKALVKHNLRNEEFEKSLKELKKAIDEQRNNSKETADTLEKEFTELWQSVDVHLKEFKVDLFSEASRKIEEKATENFHANTEQIDSLNEQIKELKAQINSFDVNQLKQDLLVEIAERISTKENDRSNEINALKKELDLLREENQIVKEQLAANSTTVNEAITGLRGEIEKLQKQQIESTEQQIKSTEQQEKDNKLFLEVDELHKKIELFTQENQELKGQIKQEIAQLRQINQSNQTADLENIQSEVTQLKQENSIAQEENTKIAKELNEKIESLKQNHQSTQNLRLDLESLVKTEVANVEEKINKMASNTNFETETNELKQQNESVKNQIESLTSDIALLKEANTELNNSLESVKSELVTSKTEVADLTNAVKNEQRNNEEIIGNMQVLETNVQLLQEELKQHQQNVRQASSVNLNFEDAQQQINDLKSSVEIIKEKASRAMELVEAEQLKHKSDRTSLTGLQFTISNLAEKQKTNDELMDNLQTQVSHDRQVFEEFEFATEKQLQGLDYKDLIDALSQRVSTVQESVDKFEADFKPNALAIIDVHQALTSVSDTCQKLSTKYDKLDDAVQHVSKSVDANNVTFDNFTKQLKTIETNKLPGTMFTEFVANDWNSHIKSFNELQGLVKSLCETVKNPVAFSSDSPHDHTHEIKYEEEFNVTAKKSTTLVQSIRTNNNNGHQSQHNRAGQMDRMNKVFAKFLAGTGVGIAAGLMSQLILMDRATSVQDARHILRKIVQTGLSFGILIGLSKITSHALHSLHLFNGTAKENQPQKSISSKTAITPQFLGYNLVGSLFASVCLTGLSGHWNVVTKSTLIGTCSALMFHICLRLRKRSNVHY